MTLHTTLAIWAVLLPLVWAEDETVGGHPPEYDDDNSSNDSVMDNLDYLFYEYSAYMIVLMLAVCLVACIGGMCTYKVYCRTARGASLYNAVTGNHAAEIKAKFKQRTGGKGGGKSQGKGAPSSLIVDDEYDALERASTASASSTVDNSNVPIFLRGTKAAESYASTPAAPAPSSRLSAAEDGAIAKVAKPKRYKTKTATQAPSHSGAAKKASSSRSSSGGAKKGRKSSSSSRGRGSGSNISI